MPSVPLQPVVGRWKIAYRLLLWSWLLIPLILAYAFLCLVAWAGERADHGKARLFSRVDKWNPYPANTVVYPNSNRPNQADKRSGDSVQGVVQIPNSGGSR